MFLNQVHVFKGIMWACGNYSRAAITGIFTVAAGEVSQGRDLFKGFASRKDLTRKRLSVKYWKSK